MITRRTALAGLTGFAADWFARPARAAAFPARAITIIVPYPAGGPVDVVARLIANAAAAELQQPVVVEDRGGGSGVIGTVAVARAAPDGYTLVLGTNQTHASNQSLLKTCPYDAVKDFTPVAGVAEIQHVLVVAKDVPVQTVPELIKLSQARVDGRLGGLTCGSSGIGSASHLAAELFAIRTGAVITHVPFRGAAPLVTALLGGHVQMAFVTLPSVVAQIESGDLRALALASGKRSARMPQLPTLRELGIDGVEANAWLALFAPAHTPADIVERLYQATSAALSAEAGRTAIAKQGMTLALRPPAAVAAWLPGEVEKWAEVIRRTGLRLDQ